MGMQASRRFLCGNAGALVLCSLPLLYSAGIPLQITSLREGFVPDAKTAVRIAEAVREPIYGEKLIASEKPLSAVLNEKGEVWHVLGRMPAQYNKGGVAEVEIAKPDGRILRVWHGK